ncbi:hypothetical protein [Kineococcus arenarius]|uniref:hypothetical protein n=1 Tax=Kineococcus sp. SYSU DK007 TaxID=3383128 RepID=UPI003D7CFEED
MRSSKSAAAASTHTTALSERRTGRSITWEGTALTAACTALAQRTAEGTMSRASVGSSRTPNSWWITARSSVGERSG